MTPPIVRTTDTMKSMTSASLTTCCPYLELLTTNRCRCSNVNKSVMARPEKLKGPKKPEWYLYPTPMHKVPQNAAPKRSAAPAFRPGIASSVVSFKGSGLESPASWASVITKWVHIYMQTKYCCVHYQRPSNSIHMILCRMCRCNVLHSMRSQ